MSYFTLNNLWVLIRQLADIACVWALVYYCLKIVKNNSRTIQIFKGILLVIIVKAIATYLELNTIAAMTTSIMNWGVPAIIIIFQPEIRSILEKIGKTRVFSRIFSLTVNERENLVDELVKACAEMSKTKTGALISIEQGHSLSDFIKTGTPMNSVVSSELLCSIFQYGTPLHDGAVIIQGVKIACAAAYFPPTSRELPTSYGARHRAAVGISEITDSITIIVSEETGNISIAQEGKLTVYSEASLREFLMNILGTQSNVKEKEESSVKKKESKPDNKLPAGKKQGVFAHYFKGKNRRAKNNVETANKYTKKKKDKQAPVHEQDVVIVENSKEKIEIEDLAVKQDAPLDQLFETIVDTDTVTDKKDMEEEAKEVIDKTSMMEETLMEPVKKKRKRRTKAQIEADKAKEDRKKEESQDNKKQKKETKKKKEDLKLSHDDTENHSKVNPLSSMGMADDLFNDVIEPEAIVLHYEKADEEDDSSLQNDDERSDS